LELGPVIAAAACAVVEIDAAADQGAAFKIDDILRTATPDAIVGVETVLEALGSLLRAPDQAAPVDGRDAGSLLVVIAPVEPVRSFRVRLGVGEGKGGCVAGDGREDGGGR